jgi:hypothetical protein
MKTYIIRFLFPSLCFAMVGFLVLEWIDRTLLLDAPSLGYWADTGVWVVIFLGGMMVPMFVMRWAPTQIAGVAGMGKQALSSGEFFKFLGRGMVVAVVFAIVCKFVNAIVLDQLLELARPEVPWLDGEQWIMGTVVGLLLFGGPVLQTPMTAEAGD